MHLDNPICVLWLNPVNWTRNVFTAGLYRQCVHVPVGFPGSSLLYCIMYIPKMAIIYTSIFVIQYTGFFRKSIRAICTCNAHSLQLLNKSEYVQFNDRVHFLHNSQTIPIDKSSSRECLLMICIFYSTGACMYNST